MAKSRGNAKYRPKNLDELKERVKKVLAEEKQRDKEIRKGTPRPGNGGLHPRPDGTYPKLSWEKACEIRKLNAEGMGVNDLASRYGVTHSNIHAVVTWKTWKVDPSTKAA